jgi:hypothetical protein
MKTIGRILSLLITAFVVIGVTYAISQTTAAQSLIGNQIGPDGNEGRALPAELGSGQGNLPAGVSGRLEEGGSPVVTLGRNLLIVGTMVLVVQLLRLFGRELKSIAAATPWKGGPTLNRSR